MSKVVFPRGLASPVECGCAFLLPLSRQGARTSSLCLRGSVQLLTPREQNGAVCQCCPGALCVEDRRARCYTNTAGVMKVAAGAGIAPASAAFQTAAHLSEPSSDDGILDLGFRIVDLAPRLRAGANLKSSI